MNPAPDSFRKLPGLVHGWNGRSRLWVNEEYLLEVCSVLVMENYRRFLLKDIRSILIQRTRLASVWNMVLGVISGLGAALCGGLFWGGQRLGGEAGRITLWVFAGFVGAATLLFLVLLLFNLLRGPSCRCFVENASGRHELAAPRRLRGAERVLRELTPRIEAIQLSASS